MNQIKFNKMTDKYYSEKLKEYFINFLAPYNIDKKFYMTRNNIEMLIKNRKWKEDFYVLVFSIPYQECFKFFVSDYEMDKLKDDLIRLLEKDHIKPIMYIFNMSDRIIVNRDIHINNEEVF